MGSGSGTRLKLFLEVFRTWAPIIVSLCAITLTVVQARISWRHMSLSVQPRLDWRFEQDSAAGTLRLGLVNTGLGPAAITDVSLVVDGTRLDEPGLEACTAMDRALGRDGSDWHHACSIIEGEYVLRSGDTFTLYASRPSDPPDDVDLDAPMIDVERISVEGRYCSFYEECWQIGER